MARPRPTVVALLAALVLATGCGTQDRLDDQIERAEGVADDVRRRVDEARQQFEDTAQRIEFCAAAGRVVTHLEREDYAAAIEAGQTMVAEAPSQIQPQARIVLDGLVAFRDGDPEAVQGESFRRAAEDVRNYTVDACDPRE